MADDGTNASPSRRHLALPLAGLARGCRASADSEVTDFLLDNGMEVVVIPDHRAPIVTHMVWYKIGSADEPPGKSGIAHFFEHLMFKATTNHAAGEFDRASLRHRRLQQRLHLLRLHRLLTRRLRRRRSAR